MAGASHLCLGCPVERGVRDGRNPARPRPWRFGGSSVHAMGCPCRHLPADHRGHVLSQDGVRVSGWRWRLPGRAGELRSEDSIGCRGSLGRRLHRDGGSVHLFGCRQPHFGVPCIQRACSAALRRLHHPAHTHQLARGQGIWFLLRDADLPLHRDRGHHAGDRWNSVRYR